MGELLRKFKETKERPVEISGKPEGILLVVGSDCRERHSKLKSIPIKL
jgi:hypothetical protein